MATAQHEVAILPALGTPLTVTSRPIPTATSGSAVIQVIAGAVSPNTKVFFSEHTPLPLPTPMNPSFPIVGRIHAVGPDSTSLKAGQLVLGDFFIRSRDAPNDDLTLQGYMSIASSTSPPHGLMTGEWSHGGYAQYARMPLENVFPINEDVLINRLGYAPADLLKLLATDAVASGSLFDSGVKAGDSVIVAPATGYFGGGAVHLALAMGLHVIAASRTPEKLANLERVFGKSGMLSSVVLSGEIEEDVKALKAASGSPQGADAYVDWSPPQAQQSTHFQACLASLRPYGKAFFLGGVQGDINISYRTMMGKSLSLSGKLMYERHHVQQIIKMVEKGLLKLGPGESSGTEVIGGFKLKDANEAIEAAENNGWDKMVVIEP